MGYPRAGQPANRTAKRQVLIGMVQGAPSFRKMLVQLAAETPLTFFALAYYRLKIVDLATRGG